jgi:hypothetical protein
LAFQLLAFTSGERSFLLEAPVVLAQLMHESLVRLNASPRPSADMQQQQHRSAEGQNCCRVVVQERSEACLPAHRHEGLLVVHADLGDEVRNHHACAARYPRRTTRC